MIRIDEIYDNTFWAWFQENRPGMRMFFCDPPGNTSPDALFNHGSDTTVENDFVFFHDQEPIHLDTFTPLFERVKTLTGDIGGHFEGDTWIQDFPNPPGHVVVSEQGEYVKALCDQYGWIPHYYFYHGWACLDWFRGYDRTFLIPRARNRRPTRTFMSPNRIVAGKRDHRVLFLYNVFKNNLQHNHISAPRICPVEGIDIASIAQKYTNVYQDIADVFRAADLPRMFAGEDTQEMSSYRLGNFSEARDSLVYVPTETVYFGRRRHITEKTFKAIALEMPFVLVAPAGSLEYLRSYGFRTFANVFDESYDEETDDVKRIERVVKLLKELDDLTPAEREQIHRHCLPIVEYNYNHFYQGNFATVLWQELTGMLSEFIY
jgi:hypothetical protein